MSSFFTKRKRADTGAAPSAKRGKTSKSRKDEEISSSNSEDETLRKRASDEEIESESSSEDEDETTQADRRRKLAERYLENIKGEVDEIGFDAEDVDRDLIAERLQEDVAETKGRMYRQIASTLSFSTATPTQFRSDTLSITSIATCHPYAYTVSKDMTLTKWELPAPPPPPPSSTKAKRAPKKPPRIPRPLRRRPIKLIHTKGNKNKASDSSYPHHIAPILTVAASDTGKFVATGGADKRLIIWSASDLKPLRVFTQHRDSVTSLAFRRGTNQLYSASKDRTIKTWSLDELAYVETLFGHQDEVVDVAGLALERCISVGARDRSARFWKIVEETQLVFRGGGTSERKKALRPTALEPPKSYAEGSIDRVALIDEETFVTGSDNGSISLWTLHKKKPIHTIPLAHGLCLPLEPEEASAENVPNPKVPERQPRWITALATVPYSDLVLSGSWDGSIRTWKVTSDKKKLEPLGSLGSALAADEVGNGEVVDSITHQMSVRGVINDLSIFLRGERGEDGLCVCAAVGSEHRMGRWIELNGGKGKNGAVVFEVPKISQVKGDEGKGEEGKTIEDGS